ncbi:MAG: hypothetical protein KF841_06435 [Phycisphaerae bacterium]|nr:hypothetical protein [Phycisphaerae bacterium]
MTQPNQDAGDRAWEKEYAPKISKRRLITVASIYAAFVLLLAALSFERWFVSFR